MVSIENWTEYRSILTFPIDGYIEVNYRLNNESRAKRVGCFSVFADSLRNYDYAECERMLEEYERRKDEL